MILWIQNKKIFVFNYKKHKWKDILRYKKVVYCWNAIYMLATCKFNNMPSLLLQNLYIMLHYLNMTSIFLDLKPQGM